jgi:2-keto-4-pentenoate hydratase
VVLAGAATAAEPLAAGMEVRLDAGWLGTLSVRVEP